jgi:hypothetical protein
MFDDSYIPLESLVTRLSLPKKYLKRLAEAGDIPCLNVNGHYRFNEQDVRHALTALAINSNNHEQQENNKCTA